MVALCSKSSAPTIISYKHTKRLIVTSAISLLAIYVTDVRALFIDITDQHKITVNYASIVSRDLYRFWGHKRITEDHVKGPVDPVAGNTSSVSLSNILHCMDRVGGITSLMMTYDSILDTSVTCLNHLHRVERQESYWWRPQAYRIDKWTNGESNKPLVVQNTLKFLLTYHWVKR